MSKRIAFCNFYEELNRDNFMFRNSDVKIGDDLLAPFVEIKKYADSQQIEIATVDVMGVRDADAVVFIDMPRKESPVFKAARDAGKELFLIMLESRLVRSENYLPENHRLFRRIFTYDDSLVDGRKFIKINYSYVFPDSVPSGLAGKEKLCTMIAGNKNTRHPQELYSERLETIRWFEQHHPEDFDLYGVGWDRSRLMRRIPDALFRTLKALHLLPSPAFTSYRGTVERKRDVMGRYRFAFCYENIRGVPGYITEKIFDAFFSGTVPVYLGADNITDHIPADCFIDRRAFRSCSELYEHLKGMDDSTYRGYIDSVAGFLRSPAALPFTAGCFARTVLTGVTDE